MKALRDECFRAWPATPNQAPVGKPAVVVAEGLRLTMVESASEEPFSPTLWLLHRDEVRPKDLAHVVLKVLDDEGWDEFRRRAATSFPAQFPGAQPDPKGFGEERKMLVGPKSGIAYFCPRGVGPTSLASLSPKKRTHLLRRLALLGETLESGQVWDITQAAAALRSLPGMAAMPLWLQSRKTMAADALYAALFIPDVEQLDLHALPPSHRQGPTYLNVLRHLDIPQAVALAAERSTVVLYTDTTKSWRYPQSVAASLGWEKRLQIREHASNPER
jgi:hypothetical protein